MHVHALARRWSGSSSSRTQLKLNAGHLAPITALALAAAVALTPSPGLAASSQPDGQKIFDGQGCAGCHGENGNGGMGTRLRGDQKLSNTDHVIHQIINGGGGMPAFGQKLSNAQIAAVGTYVRTHFGNNFGDIAVKKVADAKSGSGGNASSGNSSANSSGDGADAGSPGNSKASDSENPAGADAMQNSNDQSNESSDSGNSGNSGKQMDVGAAATNVKQPTSNGPTQDELDNAGSATDSWLMYNKGYKGQRYSSLKQINADNAADLRPVCVQQLGTQTPFQGSPIVYDGSLYITTAYSVFALDATTCHTQWSYTYSPTGNEPFNTNRGVAIAGGRVFRGTSDGHVIALDAKTGDLLWNIRPVDSGNGYFLSSAPIVWHDMVFTGTAGADWGAPAKMFAFDVKDGHTVWTFDEIKDETFGSADKAATGGGSNWTSYALDTNSGKLYIPVGNPAPDFAAKYRPGKNLYTNSTIVLDAKTGQLDHYYQQIPNDDLDRDTAASPVLFSLEGGKGKTLYVAQTNKAGHMFLYNDDTKKQVFKVETTTLKNAGSPPTTEGTHVCPGIDGGNEWYGPAYDPQDQSLYVPAVDWCTTFTLGEVRYTPGQFFFGGSYTMDKQKQAQGWITAFDAKTGETKWKYHSDLPMVAGVTPTAGGVLFSGELTGDFIVLNEKTGKKLYSFYTGGPIAGGVSTYKIGGRQYVAVASGNESRTWSPEAQSSATIELFALPKSDMGQGANNG